MPIAYGQEIYTKMQGSEEDRMGSIRLVVRTAIRENSPLGDYSGDDDTDLLATGNVDSLAVWAIVSAIETHIGCALSPGDVTADNFRTVHSICALAERQTKSLARN
jgi:acyl carrier protein